MPISDQTLLINLLGHATGALIFAIFLALLYSGRGWSGGQGRFLSGFAAALSLLWNLGSLAVLAWPSLPRGMAAVIVALSFSVLSLLPAVLLHLALGNSQRLLVWSGYGLSVTAVVMHCWEISGERPDLHQMALRLITIGFLVLTAAAVFGPGRRPGGMRMAVAMCLALFATSFVHFGAGHPSLAWSSELFVHHAGIPLALFVLLQDYRFVLLDAFVRFLANALLAGLLTALVIAAAFRLVLVGQVTQDPSRQALLLASVCLFLVLFAWLRERVQGWLTRAIFRQGSVAELPGRVKDPPAGANEERYLEWAGAQCAAAVETNHFAVVAQSQWAAAADLHAPAAVSALGGDEVFRQWGWAETVVPLRFGSGQSKLMLLGRRKGGRRYLSEDLDALARAAAEISTRVESLRQAELDHLVSQAELRALQSQINPHFLFNALNTLYGTIPREAAGARRMVLNLAEIFRYFLQTNRTFVPLAQELEIVNAYLEVEQLRLGGRLTVTMEVDEAARAVPIPVLSVQPLVENAVKHGVAARQEPGYVRVRAMLAEGQLRVSVENNGSGPAAESQGAGMGLANVRRRLEICYGAAAELRLEFGEVKTTAELAVPLAGVAQVV